MRPRRRARFATGETMHDVHFVGCLDAAARAIDAHPRPPSTPHKSYGRGCAQGAHTAMAQIAADVWLAGQLCRCGSHPAILAAVMLLARR